MLAVYLGDRAKELTTSHRMNQVLTGLEQYERGQTLLLAYNVPQDMIVSWPACTIITFLTDELGNDIRTFERDEHLPPV